ncbi:MAG: protein kinase [Victivallales bacterium]|nr:protein kinase [Victivallales bacterium]
MEQSQITPVECCGHGGYGEIWLVKAPFGQNWALKIIDKTKLDKSAWEREVNAVQKYRAAIGLELNLIYVQQAGDLDDYFFYLMETADNLNTGNGGHYMPDTLENRLHERRLTFKETQDCIHGLLDGLQILHKHGLIHRDIKPANIFFVNGKPKFGDLGLVTEYNPTLSFAGTEGFCPPSLLKGEQVDGKMWDLYSLGMVVYCCVTGYASACFPEIPEDLMDNPTMRALNRFFERACSPEPHECFKTVDEFRKAFDNCFPQKNLHRKKMIEAMLAGIIIGGVLATCWMLLNSTPSRPVAPPAVQPTTPSVQVQPDDPTPPSVSTIQAFKRGSIAKFYDPFLHGAKTDWLITKTNDQPLQKVGIAGLFWNCSQTAPSGNQLTLALPSLSLPVNFEIAWECFGDFNECSLFIALSTPDDIAAAAHGAPPQNGVLFELLKKNGNASLKRIILNGQERWRAQSAATVAANDENDVFITTNRIVKDGDTFTIYLDEQAMFTMKLTQQDIDLLKNARFSMTYQTAHAGIAVIKNFTVFYVPGLE